VVTNSADLPVEEFKHANPTAAASYVLNSDCADLDDVLTALIRGDDWLREDRHTLRVYRLGPDDAGGMARFQAEFDRVVAGRLGA
jgi:hypothetical protein